MKAHASGGRMSFGVFEVDLRSGELRKQGIKIKLHDQPFQILTMLLEHPGEVVTREQLQQRLWPADTFVDFDVGLNSAVKKLRDALSDSAETPRYVETLPRRGYRFIAEVEPTELTAASGELARATPFRARVLWPALAAFVLLGVLAGYLLWLRPADVPAGNRVMLAVLPFENLTGDPAQEYFNDGFTEEMIAWLAQYQPEQLGVIARTSSMKYKGTAKSITEIGHELAVDYVLEGSVRRESDVVRITAQLIRVADQAHVWSKSYDRELRHILALQSDVAGDIARQIRIRLSPDKETGMSASREVDPRAYEAYVRGLFLWQRRDKQNLEKAMEYFEEAVRRDPTYALAYAALGRTRVVHTGLGHGVRDQGVAKAQEAALQALKLQPNLGEAHSVLGWVHLARWEWEQGEKSYRRAIELSPNDPIAHLWLGHYLLRVGRLQESLLHRQRAHELDPLDTTVTGSLAVNLYRVGRKSESIGLLEKSREFYSGDAGRGLYHFQVAWYYFQEKDYPRARQEQEEAVRLCRRCPAFLGRLGHILAVSGNRALAEGVLQELQERSKTEFVSPFHIAIVHAGLGDLDQAFEQLERAFGARDFLLFSLQEESFLSPLRGDPRFQNLLRRMNFPETPRSRN